MPYCTVDNVQALRPQVPITTSSRPTIAQVEAQIGDLCAYVDGVLSGLGFVVPITGPISLAYLKAAVAWGVAGLAELQQTAGIAAQGQAGDTVRSQYWALFQAALDNIRENPNASYAYFGPGEGFRGARLILTLSGTEESGEMLEKIRGRVRSTVSADPETVKHVAYFKVVEARSLV